MMKKIRLFFAMKCDSSFSIALYVLLGTQVFFWPLHVLEKAYIDGNTGNYTFAGLLTLAFLAAIYLGYINIVGIVHIVIWLWAAITIYTHGIETYVSVVFYVLMIISLFWIATLWWSDDVDSGLRKKGGNMFFKRKKTQDNKSLFLNVIQRYIADADNHSTTFGSCEEYIMPQIKSIVSKSENEIKTYKDDEYVELMAVKVLYNVCFDALSSGELNMYRGQLDPMKPGNKLIYIVEECLSYYLEHGIASRDQIKDQMDILWENIESVG